MLVYKKYHKKDQMLFTVKFGFLKSLHFLFWMTFKNLYSIDLYSRAMSVNGTRSKLTYTPRNNKDYGTLMCEAKNEVGKQKHPCIFHIILAGKYFKKH